MNKVNHRKEFFRASVSKIRQEVENLGLSAKWTMVSEAREYRETLSLEEAIKADATLRENWVKRQLQLEAVDDSLSEVLQAAAE